MAKHALKAMVRQWLAAIAREFRVIA